MFIYGGYLMNKTIKRQGFLLLLLLTAGCFILSSCGLSLFGLSGGGAKSDIEDAVKSYLDEIQDGSFSDSGYKSDYAEDTPFADLTFEDPDVKDIMDKGLEKMDYEIGDISGSVKDEEGTCDVTVTAIDAEEIISDLEDEEEGYDADTLMHAVRDKDAPTDEYDITLDMTYDASSKEWLVSDSDPLIEIFADPYADVSFGPIYGDPVAAVDTFLTALANCDADSINAMSPNYDATYFFDEQDAASAAVMSAVYSRVTYDVTQDPEIYDTYADVYVSMSMPDIYTILDSIGGDTDFLAVLMKPYILAEMQGGDTAAADEQFTELVCDELASRIAAADAPYITFDDYFELESNDETGKWDISIIPYSLYDFELDPFTDLSDEDYMAAAVSALDTLLQEGTIDQASYDAYLAQLSGDTSVSALTSPADDIYDYGWYDENTQNFTESYDAASTVVIEYFLEFYSYDWGGTVFTYDWYNQNGTVLCYSDFETLADGEDYIMPSLTGDDNEPLPADTYRLVISLADGSVVQDVSVTVQ